ncbi:hypothetical protein VTO73DRAFT_6848 [Trametes versicolor]
MQNDTSTAQHSTPSEKHAPSTLRKTETPEEREKRKLEKTKTRQLEAFEHALKQQQDLRQGYGLQTVMEVSLRAATPADTDSALTSSPSQNDTPTPGQRVVQGFVPASSLLTTPGNAKGKKPAAGLSASIWNQRPPETAQDSQAPGQHGPEDTLNQQGDQERPNKRHRRDSPIRDQTQSGERAAEDLDTPRAKQPMESNVKEGGQTERTEQGEPHNMSYEPPPPPAYSSNPSTLAPAPTQQQPHQQTENAAGAGGPANISALMTVSVLIEAMARLADDLRQHPLGPTEEEARTLPRQEEVNFLATLAENVRAAYEFRKAAIWEAQQMAWAMNSSRAATEAIMASAAAARSAMSATPSASSAAGLPPAQHQQMDDPMEIVGGWTSAQEAQMQGPSQQSGLPQQWDAGVGTPSSDAQSHTHPANVEDRNNVFMAVDGAGETSAQAAEPHARFSMQDASNASDLHLGLRDFEHLMSLSAQDMPSNAMQLGGMALGQTTPAANATPVVGHPVGGAPLPTQRPPQPAHQLAMLSALPAPPFPLPTMPAIPPAAPVLPPTEQELAAIKVSLGLTPKPQDNFPTVHLQSPEDRLRGMSPASRATWDATPEDQRCFAEIFKRRSVDIEQACTWTPRIASLIFKATRVPESDYAIDPPADRATEEEDADTPGMWRIRNLPPFATSIMVVQGTWAMDDYTVGFYRGAVTHPTFMLAVTGFTQLQPYAILATVRAGLRLEKTFQKLCGYISNNPDYQGAPNVTAVAEAFIDSVGVRTQLAKTEIGRVLVSNIYMRSPTKSNQKWLEWRDFLRERTDLAGDRPSLARPLVRCVSCHGVDHEFAACPFPHLENWKGPRLEEAEPGSSAKAQPQKQSSNQQNAQAGPSTGTWQPRGGYQGGYPQGIPRGARGGNLSYCSQNRQDSFHRGRGGGSGGKRGAAF